MNLGLVVSEGIPAFINRIILGDDGVGWRGFDGAEDGVDSRVNLEELRL
jgi:hypothetical protein